MVVLWYDSYMIMNIGEIKKSIAEKTVWRSTTPRLNTTPSVEYIRLRNVENHDDFWYVGYWAASSIEDLSPFGANWFGYCRVYKPGVEMPKYAPRLERVVTTKAS